MVVARKRRKSGHTWSAVTKASLKIYIYIYLQARYISEGTWNPPAPGVDVPGREVGEKEGEGGVEDLGTEEGQARRRAGLGTGSRGHRAVSPRPPQYQ